MLSENQSLRAGSLPLIFHSGIIGRGLRAATDTAADVLSQNSAEVTHNRQLLTEALCTCSCRRSSNRPAAAADSVSKDAYGSSVADDAELRPSAEVAKHLAQTLVELVTPDVMYNDISWPEEDFVHVTIERDLIIWRRFEENPVIWDIMDFLSTGVGAMKYCSCLLRSCTATLINQWESSREKLAKNQPKLLAATCRVIEFMRKGQLLPEPLCYTGDILHHVSSYEVYLLLVNIWTYVKDNAPLPGTRLNNGCGSHYTDVIRAVVQNNISQLGHLCLLFFPPVATSASETTN